MREAPVRDPLAIDVRWNHLGWHVVLFVLALGTGVFLAYASAVRFGPAEIFLGLLALLTVVVGGGAFLNAHLRARLTEQFQRAQATVELGQRFEAGRGVIKDDEEARRHYRRALGQLQDLALQADAATCAACAALMEDIARRLEPGTYDQSLTSAYFLRAALMGAPKAQAEVARRYLLGRGLTQSLADAYAWYNISAATFERELADGSVDSRYASDPLMHEAKKAAQGREEMAKVMTPEGVAEGQRRSRVLLRQIAQLAPRWELKF